MLYNIRKAASERKLTLSTFDILLPIKIAVNISMYIARPIKLTAFVLIKNESNLNIKKLDLKDIYNFLKDNQKLSKNDAKIIVEEILIKIKNI